MKMKIKFNWKRIAAAALAGVLACSMLSGCKKGGTTGKNEIMYYFYGTEAPDTAMVMEKVNEKLKEKTGYTIKYKFLTSDNYDLVSVSYTHLIYVSVADFYCIFYRVFCCRAFNQPCAESKLWNLNSV